MNELSGSPQQAATLLYFYMYLVFSLLLLLLLILLWFVIYLIFIFQGLKMYYTTFSYILLLLWCAFLTILSWRAEDWEESLVYFHVHPLYLAYRIWAHGSAARYFPPRQLQTSSWFSHFPKKDLGEISVILFLILFHSFCCGCACEYLWK